MAGTLKTQRAVQLIGPDKLTLNERKEIVPPAEHQILCKVEAIGLCFSDLKLLKQFSTHARKEPIISGIDESILRQIPSYVPGEMPTVPGHEAVVRVEEVGPGVEDFRPGQRYLVQTDYRWLPTENSNGSFGYNFEGALQEYVLMDKRVITSPAGQSMLIPVSENLSAAAVALIEPWACVEDAYACSQRREVKVAGQMLIAADVGVDAGRLKTFLERYGMPGWIIWVSKEEPPEGLGAKARVSSSLSELPEAGFDDVLYFGAVAETTEELFAKVATQGLLNIVQCGGEFGRDITTTVGRVHYGGIRIVGTTGSDPCESMERIPKDGEIEAGEKINVVGAGGPMGMMHVIRNICQGIDGIIIFAGDVDERRLAALERIAGPIARKNNVAFSTYNATRGQPDLEYDYVALMAPVPALVAEAVRNCAAGGVINIFAGIPASVKAQINLDRYIEKGLYFIGTSGSTLEDMKTVLGKVESGRLGTNTSLAAVCGLEAAVEGIRAVENRTVVGKIMVYPRCKGLPLTTLEEVQQRYPEVAECLDDGLWTREAEEKLLQIYGV